MQILIPMTDSGGLSGIFRERPRLRGTPARYNLQPKKGRGTNAFRYKISAKGSLLVPHPSPAS